MHADDVLQTTAVSGTPQRRGWVGVPKPWITKGSEGRQCRDINNWVHVDDILVVAAEARAAIIDSFEEGCHNSWGRFYVLYIFHNDNRRRRWVMFCTR
jgi:hypothetical protein